MPGLPGSGSRASLLCPWRFVRTSPTSPWLVASPGCREERAQESSWTLVVPAAVPGQARSQTPEGQQGSAAATAPALQTPVGSLVLGGGGSVVRSSGRVPSGRPSACAPSSGAAAEPRGAAQPESWGGFWSRHWPWAPLKHRCSLQCGGTTHVLRLSWSPDGHYLVSAHAMNNSGPTAQIIEREGWKTNMDFVGHRKAVTVVVSLLGLWLAAASAARAGPSQPGPGRAPQAQATCGAEAAASEGQHTLSSGSSFL